MPGHVKVSGTWKALDGLHVKVSGAWKEVEKGYIRVSGAWKEFYSALAVSLYPDTIALHTSGNNNPVYSGNLFNSNGIHYRYAYNGGTLAFGSWLVSGTTSDFWIRCTLNSGSLDAGSDSTGAWLAMTANRTFYIIDPDIDDGAVDADYDIEIAADSGGVDIIATQNYTPRADYIFI